MFQGEYASKMDEKGRVNIPMKFRKDLGVEFVIAKGPDGCLELYPTDAWEAYVQKLLSGDKSNSVIRQIKRRIIGPSVLMSLDKQGRILISQALRDHAVLDKDIMFVGVSDMIEVWDKHAYENPEEELSLAELLD